MKVLIILIIFLSFTACSKKSSSSNQNQDDADDPGVVNRVTETMIESVIMDRPCDDCKKVEVLKSLRNKEFDMDSEKKPSVSSSVDIINSYSVKGEANSWGEFGTYATVFHLKNIQSRLSEICDPANIDHTLQDLFEDEDYTTNFDLLRGIDQAIRDSYLFATTTETTSIIKALNAGKKFQEGEIDQLEFEAEIEKLKGKYPVIFKSYDDAITSSIYLLSQMKVFEKKLGTQKLIQIPSKGRIGFIGGVEFARVSVLDLKRPINQASYDHQSEVERLNKMDELRYKLISETSNLLGFVVPLPGSKLSVFEETINHLKEELPNEQKCFAESCLLMLETLEGGIKRCVK